MQLQARGKGSDGKKIASVGALDVARNTIRTKGVMGLYKGLNTLVVGTFAKNAVRFAAFDQFRSMLVDDKGKLSAPRSALVWNVVWVRLW